MRTEGWNRLPIIRMTNVSLLPGNWNFDDLIESTDDGILMETNRSWSIDDRRYQFQFSTEIGWEIKGGKKMRMLKNPSYSGITTEFWNSCDAICNARPLDAVGHAQLRQRPADADHGHGARRFAVALPQYPYRRGVFKSMTRRYKNCRIENGCRRCGAIARESELRRIIDTVVRLGKFPARKKRKFTLTKSPMR